jgi:hypothetical protein
MITNENALLEQGANNNFKQQSNFSAYEKLETYEIHRQELLLTHYFQSETDLIKACAVIAKACGLKVRKVNYD